MKKIITLIAICGLCVSANAQEFRAYGSKSLGMGGAGVASVRGAYSGYYNPALIVASDYYTDVTFGATSQASEGGFTNSAQKIKDLNLYKVLGGLKDQLPTLTTTFDITNGAVKVDIQGGVKKDDLKTINDGIGIVNGMGKQQLLVAVSPYTSVQVARAIAVGLYGEIATSGTLTTNANADTLIIENTKFDPASRLVNIQNQAFKDKAEKELNKYKYLKIDKNTGKYTFSSKEEYEKSSFINAMIGKNPSIQAKVAITAIFDIPVSYATKYNLFDSRNDIRVGGSLKAIIVAQKMTKIRLDKVKEFNLPDSESAMNLGLDLGGAYVFNNDGLSDGLTLALVAKNLNSPSFDVNNHTITIEPQIRFGVSYPMWGDTLEVALDYDITDNHLTESKYTSQYAAMGINYEPFSWLGIRAGMKQNMGSNPITDKPIITFGLNTGLKWFQLEGAFGIATEKFEITKTDGKVQELPAYLEGSFALVSKWGSKYVRKQPPVKRAKANIKVNKQLNTKSNKAQQDLKKEVKKLNKAV